MQLDIILRHFETPDEMREFEKGRFEIVHLILERRGGRAAQHELRAGTLFHIPARPHDSWVIGDEESVSIHFLGGDPYAK